MAVGERSIEDLLISGCIIQPAPPLSIFAAASSFPRRLLVRIYPVGDNGDGSIEAARSQA
jgi:hypothetical protein